MPFLTYQVSKAFETFFQSLGVKKPKLFFMNYLSKWKIDAIEEDLKISFKDLVKMSGQELKNHLNSLLMEE